MGNIRRELRNSQPSIVTHDDIIDDIDIEVDIKCIKSHSGVRRAKPGSFEPFQYETDMILKRNTVVLKIDNWILV